MTNWLIWAGVMVAAYYAEPYLQGLWLVPSLVFFGVVLWAFEPQAITTALDQCAGKKVEPEDAGRHIRPQRGVRGENQEQPNGD